MAGYGLSAFVYATISGYISGDNTAAFLLVLAIGTSASFLVAATFMSSPRMQMAYAPLPLSPSSVPMFRSDSSMSRTEEELDEYSAEPETKIPPAKTDVGGLRLFVSLDYWFTMIIAFCLTGTGNSQVTLKPKRSADFAHCRTHVDKYDRNNCCNARTIQQYNG